MAAVSLDLTNKGGLSGFTKCPDGFPYRVDLMTGIRSKKFDTAKVMTAIKKNSATWTTPVTTYTINDVYACLPVGKGEMVTWVAYLIQCQESVNTTCALAIGDTGTATGYFASIATNSGLNTPAVTDFNSSFFQASAAATAINKVGKIYTTEDAITVKILTAIPTNLIFTVAAQVVTVFTDQKANAQ